MYIYIYIYVGEKRRGIEERYDNMTGIYWNVNWTKCEINMGYHFGDRCNTMPKHIRILGVVRIQNLGFFLGLAALVTGISPV